ncbi:hypothetical protein CsSME_00028716 [Camellia sinensis var. sinensis]
MVDCKPCATPVSLKPPISSDASLPCPNSSLYRSLMGALQYLTITRLELSYAFHPSQFHLHAYSDLNWAGDSTNHRSQATVSRSSTEAECRSFAHTTVELSWLEMLLTEFSIPQSPLPTLWYDNLSSMSLATNPIFHSRSKHIKVDCHFVHERVAANELLLKYVPSADQVADVFTKPLSTARFSFLIDKLMVSSIPISLQGHDRE